MLKGKKILLTGITGRVGGAFANALLQSNEVWGLARYSTPGAMEYWRDKGVKTVTCDFGAGDFSGVPRNCDYVVHPGAWAGVGGGRSDAQRGNSNQRGRHRATHGALPGREGIPACVDLRRLCAKPRPRPRL